MTLFYSAVASAGARIFYAYGNKISLPLPLPLASLLKPEIATDFRRRHLCIGIQKSVHDTWCLLPWLVWSSNPPLSEWTRMSFTEI